MSIEGKQRFHTLLALGESYLSKDPSCKENETIYRYTVNRILITQKDIVYICEKASSDESLGFQCFTEKEYLNTHPLRPVLERLEEVNTQQILKQAKEEP